MSANINDNVLGQYNEYSEVRFEYVLSNANYVGNETDAERECFVTE